MATGARTEELTLSMGPQHPSTHGVLRLICTIDGEYIRDVKPDLGYLHRGMEKIAEDRTYLQFTPLTDRFDYLSGMHNNWAWALAIERLAGIEVPERAEYIRVIVAELNRIASHVMFWGTFAMDAGAFTPILYAFRDREKALFLLEMISGSRMTFNFIRYGGVKADIPPGFLEKLDEFLNDFVHKIDEYETLITGNEIFRIRTKNIGVLSAETAINNAVSGPNLRASGVNYDLRKHEHYSIYDRFEFDVPLGKHGDTFDRYKVRVEELRQSVRIIRQAMAKIPEGPVMAKLPRVFKPPAGEVYSAIEASRGELGVYLVSDGSTKPYRMHLRPPSFINLQVLRDLSIGMKIGDLIVILGSIDILLGEVDR